MSREPEPGIAIGSAGAAMAAKLATDVTAIIRAERAQALLRTVQAELIHMNRVTTLGQITASIAHEVNQPLAAILISAQTALRCLARRPPDLEGATHAIERVVRDGLRATDIVGRTRALVRKTPARTDDVAINGAISEVVTLAHGEVSKSHVRLQVQLADGLPVIRGDRVQLQQVLLNLIMNAIEAMSEMRVERRDLLISTRPGKESILVAVRDSGPGLSDAAREQIFEPFHTTKSNGLGMGLSICRSIVEAHGGRLWASANTPRGSAFQFTLPVTADGRRPI